MGLSVIIPVHNGGTDLRLCLEALVTSTRKPDEIIVVDDASTDRSGELASEYGAQLYSIVSGPVGPAAARNRGAEVANGDILVFIDADVTVHADTLELIACCLSEQTAVTALFGSYDACPPKPGLISRYKNLQHYYTHQHGQRVSSTFWAGCGAIRRSAFLTLGGYNEAYTRPSIEDIELGARLHRAGHLTWLCPEVQVAHQKQWTLRSWLQADIRDRAIPWTRLVLSGARLPTDMGFGIKSRLSALAAWGLPACLLAGFWQPIGWAAALLLVGTIAVLNLGLYRLFLRQQGLGFALGAFWLHTLFYMYSSLVFAGLFIWHGVGAAGQRAVAGYPVEAIAEKMPHEG